MEAVWEDVLEHLLDTLLTPTLYGIAARIAWMEIVANKYSSRNIEKDLACLSALRADFAAFSASVQTGRSQTETQRRAAVIDLLRDHTATIALDPAVFPRGRYEIEMQRGAAFLAASHSAASYTYGGTVWDFWGVQGSPGLIVMSRDQVLDTLYILRSISIWNQHPLPSRDLALVAIRVRNRAVDRVSCVAGGWVGDWDGAGWDNWAVTSNPAPHLRDIWVGAENLDPVPLDLIDNAGRLCCAIPVTYGFMFVSQRVRLAP